MTFLQQADHLVRNHPANKELMELGFGCEISHRGLQETGDTVNVEGVFISQANGAHWYLANGNIFPIIKEHIEIIGKPPQLQHYLRALEDNHIVVNGLGVAGKLRTGSPITYEKLFDFDPTTGAPATEKDAEAFIKLVS